jgi:disulfide bond formation protein DsbB
LTHNTIVILAALGVAGQVFAGAFIVVAGAAALGWRRPFDVVRRAIWGYELWLAFAVSSVATGGSLFFSEVAGFVPCELCWYQRICMYPLSIITLLAALRGEFRIAVYHLMVENGVVGESTSCLVSAPGGCATKWINEFGYVTIPTLALTAFVLLIELLGLATAGSSEAELT